MKIWQLIEKLQEYNEDMEVKACNENQDIEYSITFVEEIDGTFYLYF